MARPTSLLCKMGKTKERPGNDLPKPQKSLGQSRARSRVSTSVRAPVPGQSSLCPPGGACPAVCINQDAADSPGVAGLGRSRQGRQGRMGAGFPLGAPHSLSDSFGGGGGGRCLRGDSAGRPGGC